MPTPNTRNVIAGRVANRLDLGGTNCTVDAACASSLSAVKMAISELTEGRADMMITGGVDTAHTDWATATFEMIEDPEPQHPVPTTRPIVTEPRWIRYRPEA